jgi:hypothetical protein
MNNMDNINAGKMTERYCALIVGILYLVVGLAGFVPSLVSLPGADMSYVPANATHTAYGAGFGYIFGLFPTNFLHNLVRCAVGVWGIASYNSYSSSRLFNRAFAVSYALIAIMGLLPIANTTFGLMPIFGNNIWLNALAATAAGYYGVVIPAKVMGTSVSDNL